MILLLSVMAVQNSSAKDGITNDQSDMRLFFTLVIR
jgi:hypothetical protein